MEQTYSVAKEQRVFAFDASIPPVLEIEDGSTVTFEVENLVWSRLEQGENPGDIGIHNFNALAGPVFVKNAKAGDVLRVDVLDISISRAWTCWMPGMGRLGNKTDRLQLREIPIENDLCIINDAVKVPLDPMIGCIGVAPAVGSGSTVYPAYHYGGNMDLRELRIGSSLYLPVQVEGALLSVGDLHAAMGTGEVTAISLEANGQVTARISVEKEMAIAHPRLRSDNETLFVATNDTFENARALAADLAYDYLTEEKGLSPFDAYAYISARVALRFGGPACAIVVSVVPDFD